jgi:DNA processing protein
MPLHHWLQLSLTTGLGPVLIRRIIEHAGSAESAVAISITDLQQIEGIGIAKARTTHSSLQSAVDDAANQLQETEANGARLICPDDPDYPPLLKEIHDPPSVLYMLGSLEPRDLNSIAIVGSRRCSHYGREQAERFAALLAGGGFTVVSGGARGIDSAAHRGALQHPQGRTIAVLGSGLDVPYPPENVKLFRQIAQHGAVLSEFPFGTPPNAENFPRRNRVVSGMSRGVLVVEADEKSGALITARLAADDHNRTVFALPGRVDNALSSGPHRLIRDGATLVSKLEDILEALTPLPESTRQPELFDSAAPEAAAADATSAEPEKHAPPLATERQQSILSAMSNDPMSIDQLIDATDLSAPVVLQELTFMSLKGWIKRVDGQTFVRRRQ